MVYSNCRVDEFIELFNASAALFAWGYSKMMGNIAIMNFINIILGQN